MTYSRQTHRFLIIQIASAKFEGARDLERAARRALRAYLAGDVSRLDEHAADVLRMCADHGTYIALDDESEAA